MLFRSPYLTSGSATTATPLVVANTTQSGYFYVRGMLTVSTGGTIIPAFATSQAAASVVNIGSYFLLYPIGSNTVSTIGAWS